MKDKPLDEIIRVLLKNGYIEFDKEFTESSLDPEYKWYSPTRGYWLECSGERVIYLGGADPGSEHLLYGHYNDSDYGRYYFDKNHTLEVYRIERVNF